MTMSLRAALILMLASASALPAAADTRNAAKHRPGNYVVAESRIGNGTVSGAVREAALGRQVQLPSGTWIYCRHSCSETLRTETIDYWDAHGPNAIANESGIFGTLKITRPID